MSMTLNQVAELVGGKLTGDGAIQITGVAILRDAQTGQLTMADNEKQAENLAASSASAVIVPEGFVPEGIPYISVDRVHDAFTSVLTAFQPPKRRKRIGVSSAACISPTARLGADVDVHPGAVIGDDAVVEAGCTIHSGASIMADTRLGEGVTVFPNAVLYEGTIVGARSIIHAGAVIGAFGFGYETIEGSHRRGAQLGGVEIGEDVEVGANTTIDRGTYGPTVIGDGTKIDNLVMVGHNCRIGKHNLLCSQVGIAGSSETGDYVVMGGQAGMKDHLKIGSFAKIAARSGLMTDVPENARFIGAPAMAERELWPIIASQKKLPEMRKLLKQLAQRIEELEAQQAARCSDAA